MTVATEYAAPAGAALEHRPWWRSRLVLSSAIVGVMVVCYFALKGRYQLGEGTRPLLNRTGLDLEWSSFTRYLDNFQNWLSDQGSGDPRAR